MNMFLKIFIWFKSFLNKGSTPVQQVPKIVLSEFQILRNLIIKNGGNYVDGKPYLIGVRDDSRIDIFNDVLILLYKYKDAEKVYICKSTTDPGLYYTKNPINGRKGAAILCEGMYKDVWIRGRRKTFVKYCEGGIVLRQNGSKVTIRRDIDKDGVADDNEPIAIGNFEIQMHCSFPDDNEIRKVGKWSAGCQVVQRISDYKYIMNVLKFYDKKIGKKQRYSYWLTNKSNKNLPNSVLNFI